MMRPVVRRLAPGHWASRVRRRSVLLGTLALTALLVSACSSTNTYPIDFFSEMHYQKSWHAQEPPRLDSPAGAVPQSREGDIGVNTPAGGAVGLVVPDYTREEAMNLENPLDASQANLDAGAQLFALNCVQCHGQGGQGDGYMSNYGDAYAALGANPPANLTADPTRSRPDGEIFWIISNGQNQMPAFGNLLTPEQVWQLVLHIRAIEGQ